MTLHAWEQAERELGSANGSAAMDNKPMADLIYQDLMKLHQLRRRRVVLVPDRALVSPPAAGADSQVPMSRTKRCVADRP